MQSQAGTAKYIQQFSSPRPPQFFDFQLIAFPGQNHHALHDAGYQGL